MKRNIVKIYKLAEEKKIDIKRIKIVKKVRMNLDKNFRGIFNENDDGLYPGLAILTVDE
jgi:hypothetical protein